jgi:hypothetical protein
MSIKFNYGVVYYVKSGKVKVTKLPHEVVVYRACTAIAIKFGPGKTTLNRFFSSTLI